MQNEVLTPSKDYTEYWATQVVLIRMLQSAGLKVDIRDRLPIFRLWQVVGRRMTGNRAYHILQLLQALVNMRQKCMEPPHDGKRYTKGE